MAQKGLSEATSFFEDKGFDESEAFLEINANLTAIYARLVAEKRRTLTLSMKGDGDHEKTERFVAQALSQNFMPEIIDTRHKSDELLPRLTYAIDTAPSFSGLRRRKSHRKPNASL